MNRVSLLTVSAALAAGSTPGHSIAATFVQQQSRENRASFEKPISRAQPRQALLESLAEIYDSARAHGWDGYAAAPVAQATYINAYRLLESMPSGCALPSAGAEPDGQITFEWHRSTHQTLSVSVTADGELHYAALLGARRTYGTEPFVGQFPDTLLDLVQRIACA
jgi:hypothetical protein